MAARKTVGVMCSHCRQWTPVNASSSWWECSCGTRLNAVRCPHCHVTEVVEGLEFDWVRCAACGRSTVDHPADFTSDAKSYAKTLSWRGLSEDIEDQIMIFGDRVVSATGIEVPADAVVSLAVTPTAIVIAGVATDGTKFAVPVLRSELVDLRIELRDEDLVSSTPLSRFTVLGAGVGSAISEFLKVLTGHVAPSETVITVTTESVTVIVITREVSPEKADALMVDVERDISANRRAIIEAAPEEPEPEELVDLLADLSALRDSGVITDEEFERKKIEILERI
ncbi:MAG: SHOCT domain-containing protein [Actinomycetes bacterium]